ncbi:unnamed protein product, partial [Heterosigma akashiwo]
MGKHQRYILPKMEHRQKMGMAGMLRKSDLVLEGRHHSGIDDCKNIGRLLIQLCKDGCSISATSRAKQK